MAKVNYKINYEISDELKNKITAKPIKTNYLYSGDDFIFETLHSLRRELNAGTISLNDGDILVVSEKFVSTSQGNFVDENKSKPKLSAYFCYYWSKYIWGYILGPLLKTRSDRVLNLRKMPKPETLKHKQVVIDNVGFIYALKPASEGGIDLTNVPGTYASLLPSKPKETMDKLYNAIKKEFDVDLTVMLIDTDATYKFYKWYITALPYAIDGIIAKIGVFGYILGKIGNLLNMGGLYGATPLAITGNNVYKKYSMELLLYIANLADTSQVPYTKSIHDLMKKYNTYTITEKVLSDMEHSPVVIVKIEG
ncbi:coenzyme F420-0:L-glutamate ligase [Methanococcus voltae]|uniref:Coenzyme F420:L-glutamate ligase-like domain-containing protein n=1 Tax=Methanococcus voltae (strain ATCC BAA-1334 / A3) TaxID=456320 RepID=D7DUZ7_METV3|nr:coenzyme F420-0:L-glutamate ligase [Methanococcus voltae]MCS3900761.1 F420-0:gamma-glutamyl ligase-like protein [Methanococcus voltae]